MTGESQQIPVAGVRLRVTGGDEVAELLSLGEWLSSEPELRGRVTRVEASPPDGTLGTVLVAWEIAAASGGVAGALATAVVAWIRHRTADVTIRVTRVDGSETEIVGKRLDADDVRRVITGAADHAGEDG